MGRNNSKRVRSNSKKQKQRSYTSKHNYRLKKLMHEVNGYYPEPSKVKFRSPIVARVN